MAAHPKAAKKAAILSRDGCARIVDVRNVISHFYFLLNKLADLLATDI